VARDRCTPAARTFADQLRCDRARFRVTVVAFEAINALSSSVRDANPEAIVLVWLGEDETTSTARRVGDVLVRHSRAGVVVTSHAAKMQQELHGGGVLAVDGAGCHRDLGAALWGLWSRQAALTAMVRDQRLLQIAVDRMRLEVEQLHIELETAAVLQRDFMPKAPPEIAGIEVGWLFRPASYVSGDIYDAVVCPDGTLAFFLADAVGHGVSAALLTIAVSRALRDPALQASVATESSPAKPFSPGAALSELNRDICTRWRNSRWFVTAICGRYDPRTHEVTLASAGHPHPIISGPDAGAVDTDAAFKDFGGPLLGVFEAAPFDEMTFTLGEGQTLVLYTDGFELAFAETGHSAGTGGVQGQNKGPAAKRYLEILAQVGIDAAEVDSLASGIEFLATRIDDERGSLHQDDDLTVLSIRRLLSQRARLAA
jgi:sigma-B regulation protein RsbU (phosphoserine phosphatase)